VPEPPEEFWEEFPRRVSAEIRNREQMAGGSAQGSPSHVASVPGWWPWLSVLRFKSVLAIGCAIACVALALFLGVRHGRLTLGRDTELAAAQKYFREIEGLFPHQVQAIVLDQGGAHLVLADQPTVATSTPLYVKICDADGCRRYVTFSGQKIRVNGDVFDVLVDRHGAVLVVGEQSVWSSSQPSATVGRYRIEARPLPATS
jgi:hypothetical protein